MGAYQVLLSRYCGQTEVLVGTAVSGRTRPQLAGLVGCLFNVVALRGELSGDPPFRLFLDQVRDKVTRALEHQDYPLHLLAERLGAGLAVSGAPLFRTHMIYHQLHPLRHALSARPGSGIGLALDLGDLELEVLPIEQRAARSPLELELVELGGVVTGWFRYSTDHFEGSTIERMAGHFRSLLRELLEHPERPVSALSCLSAGERQLLVEEWSRTGGSYARAVRIEEMFAEQAARTPHKTAAVYEAEHVTFLELDARADRRAGRIAKTAARRSSSRGPEPMWVGLLAESGPNLLAGFLAILKSGKGVVPLDAGLPAERLAQMIGVCGLTLLVTEERHLAKASELAREGAAIADVVSLDDAGGTDPGTGRPSGTYGADRPLYAIFTSGSTGTPKGVPITHRNLVPLLYWSRGYFGFGEHTRALQSLSFGFDFGIFEILTTMLFGGTLYLLGRDARRDAAGFSARVRRFDVNTLHTTPSFFRSMATAVREGGELESIEVLHFGGEPLSRSLVKRAFELVGGRCVVMNGYGPTEASINCAIFSCGRAVEGWETAPIGGASADNLLFVLGAGARLVPPGAVGELSIGGSGLSWGYLGQPALTAEKFIPDPFSASAPDTAGGRLYRSGDRVRRRSDGQIEFLGRVDDQVKIRGYRIEPREIEAVLRRHPALAEVVVVARHDGDAAEARLLAYVLPRGEATAAELRDYLRRQLPEYMVPAVFVELEEFPRTATGKVDRRGLPAPDPSRSQLEHPYTAPRTLAEEILVDILSELLGVERISVHDNFFDLGGHSLIATQLLADIRARFRVDLPLAALFETPRVDHLALTLEELIVAELEEQEGIPDDRGEVRIHG